MIGVFFTFLVLSLQFLIKHADKDVYLCRKTREGILPPIVPCSNIEEATDFKFDDNGNGTQQVITVDGTKALSIRTDDVVIIMDAEKQRSQEFIITNVGSDNYTLKSYGKCVTQFETNLHLEFCNNSSVQFFTNVEYEKKPKAPVEPKKILAKPNLTKEKIPDPSIDKSSLDKLKKSLDENKELAKLILKSQKLNSFKRHSHRCRHHIHHHHFCDEGKYHTVKNPILIKSETAKNYGYPGETKREFIIKEIVPATKLDYTIETEHIDKLKGDQRTSPSLFDYLKN